jgi:hypothetical protein
MLYVYLACPSKSIVALCGRNLSINDGPDHSKFVSYDPVTRQTPKIMLLIIIVTHDEPIINL